MGILDRFKTEKHQDNRDDWAYWMKKNIESQGGKVSDVQLYEALNMFKAYECPGCGEKIAYIGKSNQPPLCKKCGRLTVPLAPPKDETLTSKGKLKSNKEKAQLSKKAGKINMALEAHDKANRMCHEGKREEVLEWFDKAIQLFPDEPQFCYSKGLTLLELKRPAEALPCCQKAVELCPNNADFWLNLGASFALLHRWDEAVKSYDKGLEIKPTNAKLIGNKFIAQSHVDQKAAGEYFTEALRNGGESVVKEVTDLLRKETGLDLKFDFKTNTAAVRIIPKGERGKG